MIALIDLFINSNYKYFYRVFLLIAPFLFKISQCIGNYEYFNRLSILFKIYFIYLFLFKIKVNH